MIAPHALAGAVLPCDTRGLPAPLPTSYGIDVFRQIFGERKVDPASTAQPRSRGRATRFERMRGSWPSARA